MLRRRVVPALVVLSVLGCRSETREPLAPRETFSWTAQPISFEPPGPSWRREGELSGGVKGVRFVKEGSVGEAITIGEIHDVGERDRSAAIAAILRRFDDLDRRAFLREVSLARARRDAPFSEAEAVVADRVNAALARAEAADLNNDPASARAELENARAEAKQFHVTLDDVFDTVAVEPAKRDFPDRYAKTEQHKVSIANEPAIALLWTSERNRLHYVHRDIYFVHRSHLFVARFIGLEKTLPLFERLTASIEFPT